MSKAKELSKAALKRMESLELIKLANRLVNRPDADLETAISQLDYAEKILLIIESRTINSVFRQSGIEYSLAELVYQLFSEESLDGGTKNSGKEWPENSVLARNALLLGALVLMRHRLSLMKNRLKETKG